MSKNYTEMEVVLLAQGLIGKTFGEINNFEILEEKYDKGSFGHIIETDTYQYEINSRSEPDFLEAHIELKVTPYKINKNKTLSAKERLVLNQIKYGEEYKNDFYASHFWFKNQKIQIVWYLYEKMKKRNDFIVTHEKLFEFPESDLKIVIEDYNKIIRKIIDGKAHEISEADTMYIGACTKAANSDTLVDQPFGIKAKPRAFCIKQSYMTQLVREYIGNSFDVEKILANTQLSFNKFIENVVQKYQGKTKTELKKEFKINSSSKSLNNMIICRMFGVNGNLSKTDEFLKANITPRTIRIQKNGNIKESFPFPYFSFEKIASETWEDSDLKEELETTKFMFFVFKEQGNDYIFKGIKLWNLPQNIIESSVRIMWEKTKEVILSGNIVKSISEKGIRKTNFPGMRENKICHVRPHAQNKKDTIKLPVSDNLTGLDKYMKHGFWLNNKYIAEVLKDFK